MKKSLLPFIAALIFFIVSFFTLKDYFISWDEPIHFERGQAYLHYFLTGNLDYSDIPGQDLQGTMGDPKRVEKPRRSLYQSDLHDGKYFLESDSGHPPLNGIVAALSNYIFYQKLGVLDDIGSYHLFNILSSSLLVYVVTAFSLDFFGFLPAIFSFLAISTYPLFFAESHFNIKDPVEAAFFSATFLFFWKFWKTKKKVYTVPAFVFLTLAVGTKFNALFIPIIFFLFFILRYGKKIFRKNKFYKFLSRNYLILFIGICISFSFFVISWPYLTNTFPSNLLQIFKYYKQIGTGFRYQPDKFYFFGFNTFPWQWILFTTPPLLVFFTLLGIFFSFKNLKKYSYFPLFLIIWFLIPILRVSIPGSTIYGGIRQVLEFLPAMILIASLGFKEIIQIFKNLKLEGFKYLFLILFLLPIYSNIKLHPNQNLYFNFLIGGLEGAYKKSFPSWGNSFGNVYQFGVKWVNDNVEPGSKLSLLQNVYSNVPEVYLRGDIDYKNENWSGINREGEYLMEMIFNDTGKSYHYAWDYVDSFLRPVFTYEVNGIALLKIWKNDLDNTYEDKKGRELIYTEYSLKKESNLLMIDLNKEQNVSRINLTYRKDNNCTPLNSTFVEVSIDGKEWRRMKDWIPFPQVGYKSNVNDNYINYYIAGEIANHIRLVFDDTNSCSFNIEALRLLILK